MALEIDSMLSSIRSRKHETNSPRCFLPQFKKVGVAGWKRPEMISSTMEIAMSSLPSASAKATITTRSSNRSR